MIYHGLLSDVQIEEAPLGHDPWVCDREESLLLYGVRLCGVYLHSSSQPVKKTGAASVIPFKIITGCAIIRDANLQ